METLKTAIVHIQDLNIPLELTRLTETRIANSAFIFAPQLFFGVNSLGLRSLNLGIYKCIFSFKIVKFLINLVIFDNKNILIFHEYLGP